MSANKVSKCISRLFSTGCLDKQNLIDLGVQDGDWIFNPYTTDLSIYKEGTVVRIVDMDSYIGTVFVDAVTDEVLILNGDGMHIAEKDTIKKVLADKKDTSFFSGSNPFTIAVASDMKPAEFCMISSHVLIPSVSAAGASDGKDAWVAVGSYNGTDDSGVLASSISCVHCGADVSQSSVVCDDCNSDRVALAKYRLEDKGYRCDVLPRKSALFVVYSEKELTAFEYESFYKVLESCGIDVPLVILPANSLLFEAMSIEELAVIGLQPIPNHSVWEERKKKKNKHIKTVIRDLFSKRKEISKW